MKLKSIIICTLCFLLSLHCVLPARAESNNKSNNKPFTTSDHICYYANEFDIYVEDFKDVNFETSQEIIDYIYQVGSIRQKTRDEQYTLFGKTLTEDEIVLLIEYPEYASDTYNCSIKAIQKAQELYPNDCADGELGNAFQHAYWVILMYYYTSPSFAINFAVAHENYDGNPELHSTMDLYNDYAAYNFCSRNITEGIYYTDSNLKSFTTSMMRSGDLEYIIFNYTYVKSIRYYEATGETVEITATGNFYAYTNSNEPYNIPAPQKEVVPALPGQPGLRP